MKAKKRNKQDKVAGTAAIPEVIAPVEAAVVETDAPLEVKAEFDRMWFGAAAFVVAVATFLRFYDLTLKVMHHDEGVNGFFLKNLITDGTYKYDPANYHGPTLYYISLAFIKVLGFETFGVRASVAIFGVLMVVLVLYLKDYLGKTGTLIAAF
ncbi:MAG: hypothetical protein ABL959_19045, partial [Pyrinomonadaceae bacterium]